MAINSKTVIVTGGGKGIGRAIAETLGKNGFRVIIAGRGKKELVETCRVIQSSGGTCKWSLLDVTKSESVKRFIKKIISSEKHIDVLVNNAGWCAMKKPTEKLSNEELTRTFETNVYSIFYSLREVLPIMKRQKSGTIINISSRAGKIAHPGLTAYSASKFAVQGITEAVAKEVEGTSIRSLAILPGGTNTDMRARLFGKEDAGRMQSPYAIADVIFKILSGKITVQNGANVEVVRGEYRIVPLPEKV